MRSIVPSVEKPASSALFAQSTMPRLSTPTTVLGRPIPMSMQSSLYRRVTVVFGTLDKLPSWALELVDSMPVAHLGLTDSGGAPRVMPVTFARVGGSLWTAVDSKPKRAHGEDVARVRWLRASPAAALTVDRYDDDWSRLAWVQTLCTAAVVEADG